MATVLQKILEFDVPSEVKQALIIKHIKNDRPLEYVIRTRDTKTYYIEWPDKVGYAEMTGDELTIYNVCKDTQTRTYINDTKIVPQYEHEVIELVCTDVSGNIFLSQAPLSETYFFRIIDGKKVPCYYYMYRNIHLFESPNGKEVEIFSSLGIYLKSPKWTELRGGVHGSVILNIYKKYASHGFEAVTALIVTVHNSAGTLDNFEIINTFRTENYVHYSIRVNNLSYTCSLTTTTAPEPTQQHNTWLKELYDGSVKKFQTDITQMMRDNAAYNTVVLPHRPNKLCTEWLMQFCKENNMTYNSITITLHWPDPPL